MRKTRVKDKIDRAVEALFEIDADAGNESLVGTGSRSMFYDEPSRRLIFDADQCYSFVKQLFLFLPGVFVLFQLTLSFFYFSLPFNIPTIFWLLSGSFMTIAGLGDLKKAKDWLLPISVVSLTALTAIPMIFMPESYRLNYFLRYSIYFFPFALMLPVLIKKYIGDR